MPALAIQRCFNHDSREAAAQCPECRRFYCRECVAEHDDRMVCTLCLTKLTNAAAKPKRNLAGVGRLALCAFGLLVAWFFFDLVGEGLLGIPSSFHEGTLWQPGWLDKE